MAADDKGPPGERPSAPSDESGAQNQASAREKGKDAAARAESAQTASSNGTKDEAPKHPFGVAGYCISGTVGWYALYYAYWKAELPEALKDPVFWAVVAVIWLAGSLLALWLLSGARNKLKVLITALMVICSLCALAVAGVTARRTAPSDKTYAVALFNFVSASSRSKDEADEFYDRIRQESKKIEDTSNGRFQLRRIRREPIGETNAEIREYVRSWASKRGCHLALWGNIRRESSGLHAEVHFVKVHVFGREVQGELVQFDEYVREFDGGALSDDETHEVILNALFYWGLALYRKRDYDGATRVLSSLGRSNAEYYVAEAFYGKSLGSSQPNAFLVRAVEHSRLALSLATSGTWNDAHFHKSLGNMYFAQLNLDLAEDPERTFRDAIQAYSRSAEIFRDLNHLKQYAEVQQVLADLYYQAFVDGIGGTPIDNLHNAESLLAANTGHIQRGSYHYVEAKKTLGLIYQAKAKMGLQGSSENNYERAIEAYEEALRFARARNDPYEIASALRHLGYGYGGYALFDSDAAYYENAISSFQESMRVCEASHLPVLCFRAHEAAAQLAYEWGRQQHNLPARDEALNRALQEFLSAANSISANDLPSLYAGAKEKAGRTYLAQAETARMPGRKGLLHSAVLELTAATDVLTRHLLPAARVYRERALCYRRLVTYEDDPNQRRAYLALSKRDEAAATREESSH